MNANNKKKLTNDSTKNVFSKKQTKLGVSRKIIFSIKYKLMFIMALILIVSIGIIIKISVDLIEKDKITYIYDLNSAVAKTYSSQISSGLQAKVDRIEDFISSYTITKNKSVLEERFLKLNSDLIQLNIYKTKKLTNGKISLISQKNLLNLQKFNKKSIAALNSLKAKHFERNSDVPENEGLVLNSTYSNLFSSYTILYKSKKFSNVLIEADFKGDFFKTLFSGTDVYDAFLINTSGELVTHFEIEKLISRVNVSELKIADQIKNKKTARGVMEYTSIGGKKMLGAFSFVSGWNMAIIIEVPKETAFLGARNLIENIVKITLIILVLSFFVIVFFSRTLSKPIINLSKATEEIAEGKFTSKLKFDSSDEIGRLAYDFNIMTEKLEVLTKQLVQSTKMASIGAMARSIGHEFGNILGAIIGHADLISIEKTIEGARKRAGIIIDGAERASVIIKNLKGISKSEEKSVKEEMIVSVVSSVVVLAEPDYKKKGLVIETDFKSDHNVFVDKRQLSQVFLNMFINAAHAMDKGGKMHITAFGDSKWVNIWFKDSGCGIPPENMEKIFEALFTTKGDVGTGLGLAVSKKIVEDHGGSINVESVVGEGTTFKIRIPVKC